MLFERSLLVLCIVCIIPAGRKHHVALDHTQRLKWLVHKPSQLQRETDSPTNPCRDTVDKLSTARATREAPWRRLEARMGHNRARAWRQLTINCQSKGLESDRWLVSQDHLSSRPTTVWCTVFSYPPPPPLHPPPPPNADR